MSLILDGTNGLSDVDGSASTPAIRGTDANTGIFFPAADTIAFAEGGAEVARFDSSGRLLIGTTSGTRKLTVYENAAQVDLSIVSSTTGVSVIQMGDTAADNQGQIIYRNNGDSMEFGVNGAERMRITSGGQLLVGTTTGTTLSAVAWRTTLSGSGNNLAVVNSSTDGSTTSGFQSSNYTVSGGNIINFYNGSGTFVAAISIPTNSSTGTTVTYGTGSDYRLKENVAPMTGALAKVQQLKPVTYTWKSNGYSGQGFIAHELQEIVPDCVVGEKDAVDKDGNIVPQMVDTSFLVATLTAAIQEQQQIINDLKLRIETLENK